MRLLTIRFTSRWKQTTCGHCPDYECHALPGVRGLFDEPRHRLSWQWHKRSRQHKRNRDR